MKFKMAYCIHISLILATILTRTSSGDKEKCRKAIQDVVQVVASCPRSKTEWDIAASKKNCEQFAARALCKTSKKQYVYHCVINGFRNQTLEVCAPRRIIFGHCTEYNVVGDVIQRHASAKCNSTFPRCDLSYNSTEAYKYPDCYELVYKKQESNTTAVPPEERTTTRKPDHGYINNPVIYVVISALVATSFAIVFCRIRFKRHRKNRARDEESNDLIENKEDQSIKYLCIKAKHFQHFHYVNNLTRDCELRLKKVIRDENRKKCMAHKDVMIGIVGGLNVDNLNLLSKGKEDNNMREMIDINWEAVHVPLLCFQKSALEDLQNENARYKILILSEVPCHETNKNDDSIIIVGQNKRQIKEIITTCLEKTLDEMLQDWLEKLNYGGLNKIKFDMIAEIKAIRKQLILDTSNNTASPGAPCTDNKSIVPNHVKAYLLGHCEVNSFGIWGCSTFKIFINKETEKSEIESELIDLDQNFFNKYHLKIETKCMVEKQTMRHYDSTSLKYHLGKIFPKSTKSYDEIKKEENNLAFSYDSPESRILGPCLNKAREIKGVKLELWKWTSKRNSKQKSKMYASTRGSGNDGIVQMIRDNNATHNTKKSIINSGSHVYVFIQELASRYFSYLYCA